MVVDVVDQAHRHDVHQLSFSLHVRPEISLEKKIEGAESLAAHVVDDLATP